MKAAIAIAAMASAFTTTQVVTAGSASALSFSWRWYGATVQLNHHETNALTQGTSGASAVAALIPDPRLRVIAAAGLGVFSAWAGYENGEGNCVEFNETWWGGIYPWGYRGGYCR